MPPRPPGYDHNHLILVEGYWLACPSNQGISRASGGNRHRWTLSVAIAPTACCVVHNNNSLLNRLGQQAFDELSNQLGIFIQTFRPRLLQESVYLTISWPCRLTQDKVDTHYGARMAGRVRSRRNLANMSGDDEGLAGSERALFLISLKPFEVTYPLVRLAGAG